MPDKKLITVEVSIDLEEVDEETAREKVDTALQRAFPDEYTILSVEVNE